MKQCCDYPDYSRVQHVLVDSAVEPCRPLSSTHPHHWDTDEHQSEKSTNKQTNKCWTIYFFNSHGFKVGRLTCVCSWNYNYVNVLPFKFVIALRCYTFYSCALKSIDDENRLSNLQLISKLRQIFLSFI